METLNYELRYQYRCRVQFQDGTHPRWHDCITKGEYEEYCRRTNGYETRVLAQVPHDEFAKMVNFQTNVSALLYPHLKGQTIAVNTMLSGITALISENAMLRRQAADRRKYEDRQTGEAIERFAQNLASRLGVSPHDAFVRATEFIRYRNQRRESLRATTENATTENADG